VMGVDEDGGAFISENFYYDSEIYDTKVYAYTDRPLYRPGDTVFVKVFAREFKDARTSVAAAAGEAKTAQASEIEAYRANLFMGVGRMYRSRAREQTPFLTAPGRYHCPASMRALRMSGWMGVLIWWLAFAGTHLVLSSVRIRRAIVSAIGEARFAGVYSLVALGTFVPLVWTYWRDRHGGPLLWSLRTVPGVRPLAIVLATVGFALIASSFAQPSAAGLDPRAIPRARGVTRITRHPLFAGLGLWGLAHVLINGFLTDIVFFGGFPLFAVVGGWHQDARKQLEQLSRLAPFYGETSALPFAAIAARRNRLALGELPWAALAVGAAVAVFLYYLHPTLFA